MDLPAEARACLRYYVGRKNKIRRRRMKRLLYFQIIASFFGMMFVVASVPQASGEVVVCIPTVVSVPITQGAQPYRALTIQPPPPGYVEQEFFVSCTAQGNTYETLIHVRRPENAQKFSGTVVAEPVHPSNLWSIYSTTQSYLLEAGHVYVAIVSSRLVLNYYVKPFNPSRYGSLNIPSISGIDLDIIAQVGALLKSNLGDGPLPDLNVSHVALAGYSNTGAVLRSFIAEKHYNDRLSDGGPIYDGYFPQQTAVGSAPTPIPDLDVPVIEIQGESEVIRTFQRGFDQLGWRRPDSDSYRLYEVPGQPHLNEREGEGLPVPYVCVETVRSQFPLRHVASMALRNLIEWLNDSIPPKADRIHLEEDGRTIVRDEYGNAVGGVRTSYLDVPIATYGAVSTNDPDANRPSDRCDFLGYQIDFTREQLNDLYKNHGGYLNRVNRRLDELVRDGWYLKRDADELRTEAAHADVP
jgi:hypothetical protein